MRFSPLRVAGVLVLIAGFAAHGQAAPSASGAPGEELSPDLAALYARVRAGYYHPGKIALACDASLDLGGVLTKLGGASSAESAKAFDGVRLHITTSAEGPTAITFQWPDSVPKDARMQVEVGAKPMVSGFFDNYWPLVNAEMLPPAKDQPMAIGAVGGGYIITGRGGATRLTLDSDAIVRRVENRTVSGRSTTLVLSYAAPENAQPGGLPRLSGMNVDQSATASMRVQVVMSWDHQEVSGVQIPHRVKVGLPGAFEVPITLSACTVTK